MTLVVLVEGDSEPIVLRAILDKLGVSEDGVKIIPHKGVSHLEKSLPRKLRGWTDPSATFLVMRDNDSGDCVARKAKLEAIAAKAGKEDKTVVRIVCQELEAWFLGDPVALEKAGYLAKGSRPNSVRGNPDDTKKPSLVLERLSKRKPGKVMRASEISRYLDVENNNSPSFRHTIASLKQLTNTMED